MGMWYPEVSVTLEELPPGESGCDPDRASWSINPHGEYSKRSGVTEMELYGLG